MAPAAVAFAAALLAACNNRHDLVPVAAEPAGRAAPSIAIALDAGSSGPAVSAGVYGASLATWYDFYRPFVAPSLAKAGVHLVRFPGGSESDDYHWENGGRLCVPRYGYVDKGATFDRLMQGTARPLGLDVAVTLNYGSNRTCDGGGDPAEAGAWVAYAKSHGYGVRYWTVGNENYGSWEYDLHARKHDPKTYAGAVRTGFYPAVKAADPNALLGVVGDFANPGTRRWNAIVFKEARPFDFVEIHYYPQYNKDNDAFLLGSAIDTFVRDLHGVRAEMTAAGVPASVPLYLGEFNNDAGWEGKQSVSIVNGLYLGQMLGELMNAGVPMATWWLAYGDCSHRGDYSKSLYGWQHFGSEALFSDGLPEYGCPNAPHLAGGTPFPTARVMALLADHVPPGSHVRTVTLSPAGNRVRAYGFAEGSGYAIAAFNNTLQPVTVSASIRHARQSSFAATLWVYGKEQYDRSRDGRWVGPVRTSLGRVSATVPLTLPPYSACVLAFQPEARELRVGLGDGSPRAAIAFTKRPVMPAKSTDPPITSGDHHRPPIVAASTESTIVQ